MEGRTLKRLRFTEEQIIAMLKAAEVGRELGEHRRIALLRGKKGPHAEYLPSASLRAMQVPASAASTRRTVEARLPLKARSKI